MSNKVIWQPQPKQALFMSAPEFEVLYGGAAGGGKSDALIMEATRQVSDKYYRGIIFRKTYPQLTEIIDRSIDLYKKIFPSATYNDSKHAWTFKSGAKIFFASMQHKKDRFNYQGKPYQFIAFDELTHFSWDEYSYLISRCRPRAPGQRCYMRATANPGGIGHGWVKNRFITASEPMKRVIEMIDIEGTWMMRDRVFIPATVFDNRVLLKNDPNYIANLALLPEADKKALLYGDWDSFQGQAFGEWKDDPNHYRDRKWTHVISPFEIPPEWRIYRSFDWGYSRPFSCAWWALDMDGRLYRILELYGSNGQPNVGLKWEPNKIFKEIKKMEMEHRWLKGKTIIGIADPAIWDESGGESIHQTAEKHRLYFEKGDNKRIPGKMQMHYRFAFDDNGIPMLYSFTLCKAFNRTLPALVYSEKNVEDIDTDGEDHCYDESRYLCQGNPLAPRANKQPIPKPYNPLDTHQDTYGQYNYTRY